MTDPHQLAALEGHQFLILRPVGRVADYCDGKRQELLHALPDALAHPNASHVTLRGFAEPSRIDELRRVAQAWAAARTAIELHVEALDVFPPPFKVLFARIRRSDALVDAYSSLTDLLETTDLRRLGELPLETWVFHVSLVYCEGLSDSEWEQHRELCSPEPISAVSEVVAEAELVWYRDGVEHREVIPFA